MTVAEVDRARNRRPRLAFMRQRFQRVAGPSFFIFAISALVAVAGTAGYMGRTSEVDRLDRQLDALTAKVGEDNELVDNTTERLVTLSEENQRLAADLDTATDLNQDLSARLANLEAAVQSTTDLETSLEGLVEERDQLRDDLASATSSLNTQTERLDELVPIESFGPAGTPLLFDESTDAWVTQPVCTGSMEPTIGCEDLLVVYKPTITDLDVGDIIIFRRPDLTCEGYVPGSFLLHRITRVVSSPTDGLMFETKGDANASIDPCRAPVSSVTGKVLAIVQNSRMPG